MLGWAFLTLSTLSRNKAGLEKGSTLSKACLGQSILVNLTGAVSSKDGLEQRQSLAWLTSYQLTSAPSNKLKRVQDCARPRSYAPELKHASGKGGVWAREKLLLVE